MAASSKRQRCGIADQTSGGDEQPPDEERLVLLHTDSDSTDSCILFNLNDPLVRKYVGDTVKNQLYLTHCRGEYLRDKHDETVAAAWLDAFVGSVRRLCDKRAPPEPPVVTIGADEALPEFVGTFKNGVLEDDIPTLVADAKSILLDHGQSWWLLTESNNRLPHPSTRVAFLLVFVP